MTTLNQTDTFARRRYLGVLFIAAMVLAAALTPRQARADSETAAAVLFGAALLYAAHEAGEDRHRRHYREEYHYHYRHGHKVVCHDRHRKHRGKSHYKRPEHSYRNRGHRGQHHRREAERGRGDEARPHWAYSERHRGSPHREYRY